MDCFFLLGDATLIIRFFLLLVVLGIMVDFQFMRLKSLHVLNYSQARLKIFLIPLRQYVSLDRYQRQMSRLVI